MMADFEPGCLDLIGADWVARDAYKMTHGARRYEFYERSPANVVCHQQPLPQYNWWHMVHPS